MIRSRSPFPSAIDELGAVFAEAGAFVARELCTPTPRAVLPSVPQDLFDTLIPAELPRHGCSLAAISEQARHFLSIHTARLVPPGFSAMVTTSPNPYALLAEILACAVNQHVARGDVGEFASRLEQRVVEWLGQFLGYPAASGILTRGGADANLIALAAARTVALGTGVRRHGLRGAPLVAYASVETHVCTTHAMEVLGIGGDNLRKIPTGDDFRIDIDALCNAIQADRAAGLQPFAVIAQGGSVATGAVDPLDAIGVICARENLWFHVDAAYGGPAAAVDAGRLAFAGLEHADSVAIDPHKWLYVNYESGCLLVKTAGVLESAFALEGVSYLGADAPTDAPDFMSRGVDISRGMRALKVWATFAGLGADTLRQAITQDMHLAQQFAELVVAHPQFELRAPVSLSIAVFRFVPEPGLANEYLDALNRRIPAALREDGRIYLGSTQLRGRAVLRVCLINHRVTDADLHEWVAILGEMGNALHAQRAEWWQPTKA